MKKEIFNKIVVDNIDSTLTSVLLSNGTTLAQALEIEGNRTTRTAVKFIKIEDDYVAIRKQTNVTYDYSGQTSKGDSRNADFYMGYDEIVALEFYDEIAKPIYGNEIPQEPKSERKHGIESKPKSELSQQAIDKEKKEKEALENLFIPTAGDI